MKFQKNVFFSFFIIFICAVMTLTKVEAVTGDVNGDGKISLGDAVYILQVLTGIKGDVIKPDAPTEVKVTAEDNAISEGNTISVSWKNVEGLTYNIYWDTNSDVNSDVKNTKAILNASNPHIPLSLYLQEGMTYYYGVTAVNTAGIESDMSEVVAVVFTQPAYNITKASGNQEVTVKWDAVSGYVYNIYRKVGDNPDYEDLTLNYNGTSYTDKDVNNGTTYSYKIEAVKLDGDIEIKSIMSDAVPAKPTDKQEDYSNSLGMTFKLISAGTFTMGSPSDEPGRDSDETQHSVTLTEDFYMQTTEVTLGQWNKVMTNVVKTSSSDCEGDDCPVENISWVQIVGLDGFLDGFIDELNKKGEGIYRLPTEAEWEYACRAGNTNAFANGPITEATKESCSPVDNNLGKMGWYCANSENKTHPVAKKEANIWGLYDMHGNVKEWCEDNYNVNYLPSGTEDERVVKGGSYSSFSSPKFCRSAGRDPKKYYSSDPTIGFRLVLESPPIVTIPEAPTNLQVTAKGDQSVSLSWSPATGSDVWYNLYKKTGTSGTFEKIVTDDKITILNYNVINLINGTTHYFYVTAENSAGESTGHSNEVEAIPNLPTGDPPLSPERVYTVASNTGEITVSWTKSEVASGYKIYYRKDNNDTTMNVSKSNRDGVVDNSNDISCSYTFKNLTTGSLYYFCVTAVNGNGESVTESPKTWGIPPAAVTSFTNTIGMKFNLIPAGTFWMGSPETEPGRGSDETLHKVKLTKPFYIQTTEVTQGQWENVMGYNPAFYKRVTGAAWPLEYASRQDIQDFISKLSTKEGKIYRLPTEAEWEYAARAGSSAAFANGDITGTAIKCVEDTNLFKIAWYCYNYGGKTNQVMTKLSNIWGLFDMHGNISEVCQDWYDENYYNTALIIEDPQGPTSGWKWVLRGGNIYNIPILCRSALRQSDSQLVNQLYGLRLVMKP